VLVTNCGFRAWEYIRESNRQISELTQTIVVDTCKSVEKADRCSLSLEKLQALKPPRIGYGSARPRKIGYADLILRVVDYQQEVPIWNTLPMP
jgi:hypothetical protein